MSLEHKVAVVTGAGRGIGREYARALAADGATVVVAELDAAAGDETADLVSSEGGRAIAVPTDVADEASVTVMADRVTADLGGIDILVNNAAIWGTLRPATMTDVTLDEWTRVLTVNVTGVWLTSRAVVPAMSERGGGVIVNQSSIGAYMGGPNVSHYATSKGAVNALTRAMARDLGPLGIRVNAIAPGQIANEATLNLVSEERLASMRVQQCLARAGDAADLCGPLLFLCSDAAGFMTGQVLVVDGGLVFLG
jgi:NAD(P)-dependent dehydrogenase (short-subunit alcohol dehydrogenase family)